MNPLPMNCAICFSEYTNSPVSNSLVAEFPCRHNVCVRCAAKMIVLYGDTACSQCKVDGKPKLMGYMGSGSKLHHGKEVATADQEVVAATNKRHAAARKGNERDNPSTVSLASNPKDSQPLDGLVHYESESVRIEANRLFEARCTKCEYRVSSTAKPGNTIKTNYSLLSSHYKSVHKVLLCNICIDSNRFFPDEFTHYNMLTTGAAAKSLISHKKLDHFYCKFCNIYFFDFTSIKSHYAETHQICSICQILRKPNRYFQNYAEMERHYKIEHFCCDEIKCVLNHTFAFAHASELVMHYKTIHNKNRNDMLLHRNNIDDGMLLQNNTSKGPGPSVMDLAVDRREILQAGDTLSSLHGIMKRLNIKESDKIVDRMSDVVKCSFSEQFPRFDRAVAKIDSKTNIPHYLHRSQLEFTQLRRLQNISKDFYREIDHCVREYSNRGGSGLSNYSSESLLVQDLQELISQDDILRVLELVLKKDNEFVKNYRKNMEFPRFESKQSQDQQSIPNRIKGIGFKIVNIGKKK